MTDARAVRYRQLALIEATPETARLLRLLADECDRGILCVATRAPVPVPTPASSIMLATSSNG